MSPRGIPAREVSDPLKTSGGSPLGHPSRILGTPWPAVVVPRGLPGTGDAPTPCSLRGSADAPRPGEVIAGALQADGRG